MQFLRRRAYLAPALALVAVCVALVSGCASPGPPRPPSLGLPRLVDDLSATRSGDVVELRFTVPTLTTDGLPLREPTVRGRLCRQVGNGACAPVDAAETRAPLAVPKAGAEPVVWTDVLPLALASGAPRVIGYRVELRNDAGRSAGFSDAAYTVAGAAPPAVAELRARGTRSGVELDWTPVQGAGEVLLRRSEAGTAHEARPAGGIPGELQRNSSESRMAKPVGSHRKAETPGVVWLQADPGNKSAAATVDGSVQEGVPYTYVAVRRELVRLGARMLELRSAPSAPVSFVWRDVYPPAAPTGLTAIGFETPSAQGRAPAFAVDLVWQPVNDARLEGYLVYRQEVNAAGEPVGSRVKLTPEPVTTPGFHDASAQPNASYRYSVTAIDPKGNESAAVETVVEPQSVP